MTERVLSEEDEQLIESVERDYDSNNLHVEDVGVLLSVIENAKAAIRDRDKTISDILEYHQLVLGVAKDLYEGAEGLIGLQVMHPKHPEMDTEDARTQRRWIFMPKTGAALERYDRIVFGENVGCLEGEETDEDREAFMQRLQELRETLAKVKGETTT